MDKWYIRIIKCDTYTDNIDINWRLKMKIDDKIIRAVIKGVVAEGIVYKESIVLSVIKAYARTYPALTRLALREIKFERR